MHKNDRYLIIAVILLGVGIVLFNWFCSKEAKMVVVSSNGEIMHEFKIDKDFVFDTELGNVIEVKSSNVRVLTASCPDGLCIKQGQIYNTGQAIICVPNKLVVEVK